MKKLNLALTCLLSIHAIAGCSALRLRDGDVLANTLADIQPLNDRDHYVYVWQRLVDGKRQADGIHVEHVTALEAKDEFEIAITEDGVPSSRLRVVYNDGMLALVEEDDITQGVRLSYTPPLPQLLAPLVVGDQEISAKANVQRLDDGESVNSVSVTQTMRVRHAKRIESQLGSYDDAVAVRTSRKLQTPSGSIELESAIVLVPGVGEIRSEGSTSAVQGMVSGSNTPRMVVTRRELACAIIDGKAIGDCRTVPEQLAKLRAQSGG